MLDLDRALAVFARQIDSWKVHASPQRVVRPWQNSVSIEEEAPTSFNSTLMGAKLDLWPTIVVNILQKFMHKKSKIIHDIMAGFS